MTQSEALEVLKTGVNVFLTGAPGTGKTHTINAYIKWLKDRGIDPVVTASTGIAATHIGGRTIHSFIGIGVVDHLDEDVIDAIMQRESVYKRIRSVQILIIDEISMLEAKVLNKIDKILQAVKRTDRSFGGVQMIFVGDFFQLPPVSKNGEKSFAYTAQAWREAKSLTLYLEDQYRQTEESLLDLLLSMRKKSLQNKHFELLEERISITQNLGDDEDMTRLYTHSADVDKLNSKKLDGLDGKEFIYEMKSFGSSARVESLKKSCLAPEELRLKVGARIMCVKNDIEGDFVNGSIGTVVFLSQEKIKVVLKNGKTVEMKQADWSVEEDGKVKARLIQYPLRLAWAITVHKSQGMSLDEAFMSLKDTFEYGQGYVAISRVRSLSGLYLADYNEVALEVDSGVFLQDDKFRQASSLVADKLQKSDKAHLQKLQDTFVLNCGGSPVPDENLSKKNSTKEKYIADTKLATRDLFLKKISIDDIAKQRKLKRETVAKHMEELVLDGLLSKSEIEEAFVEILPVPKDVKISFEKNGFDKLTPIYKDLEEKYSFNDLRVYRMILRFEL
jgi:ATP-dependent DNA helicase PIF1